jgi:tetratricopeptide (TPR) repeat protein
MDVAWTREDWDGVIASLERIRQIDPYDAEARTRLAEARYCRAFDMMRDEKPGETNLLEAARLELDQAVRLDASIQGLPEARSQLRMYLDGLDAYWLQDWPQALEYLQLVYDLNPDFRDTRVMLGQAYYEVAVELQQEEVWEDARDAFQQAVHLMPDFPEAQSRLALVLDAITPPRRIEIDLSDQTLTVMDNHQAVQRWPVCTGRANTPTLPGRYEVQTKLPQAYASKWDIFMPLWLGIYWAGGSENGIHALPLTRSGTVLWRERLGRPCSYGCIVMATEAEEWLYDWAELGTVVFIRR